MSNAPAGWYPQEDGRQRYWDGENWTEHFAPGSEQAVAAAGPGASSSNDAGAVTQRPWFKKKRFLIPGGVAAFFLIIGMAGAAGDEGTPQPTQAAGVLSTSSTPTPTRTQTPTATPSPTVTKAVATATPKPSATPKPTPAPKPPAAEALSARQWQKIVKDPDRYAGDRYIVYGEITQFDAATGTDSFLASVAHKNTTSYGFFDGENTFFTGDESKLDELVEGDVFKATVTVVGALSYDTQIGGSTTVALLEVTKIKRIGNNS